MSPDDEFYKLHGVPSPEDIHNYLDELPDIPDISLDEYATVVTRLHDQKGWSFKQITEFLKKQGIDTNRSAVYRCYKDASLPADAQDDPLIDDDTGEVVEP